MYVLLGLASQAAAWVVALSLLLVAQDDLEPFMLQHSQVRGPQAALFLLRATRAPQPRLPSWLLLRRSGLILQRS